MISRKFTENKNTNFRPILRFYAFLEEALMWTIYPSVCFSESIKKCYSVLRPEKISDHKG